MNTLDYGKSLRGWLVVIVVVHCAVTLWHGAAHAQIPVPLTSAQTAFVAVVILLAPFVGVGMVWTGWRRGGALSIAASMLGSLGVGFVNHFVLESPDYVAEVPAHDWRHSFILSAALVAVAETAGTALGAYATWAWWHAHVTA